MSTPSPSSGSSLLTGLGADAGTLRVVLHHGLRVLLLLGLALVVQILFPVAPVPDFPILEKGMVPDEDVIAQVGFPIYKNETELARGREDAAATVAPVFDYDPTAVDSMAARIRTFFDRVAQAAKMDPAQAGEPDRVADVLAAYGFNVTPSARDLLRSERDRQVLHESVHQAIRAELPRGVAQTADLEEARASQIRIQRGEQERQLPRDSVPVASALFRRAAQYLPRGATPELAELQRLVLIRFFEPSIRYNEIATEAARDRARQAVPVIKGEVLRGERVVAAHEQVRDADLERLRAYEEHLTRLGRRNPEAGNWRRTAGAFLFNLLVLSILGLLIFFYRPAVYADTRHVLLLAGLILALVVSAAIIARSGAPVELIPIAFPALVVAALWDGRMALNVSLVLAILLSGQQPFLGISVLTILVVAGAAAALSVRVVTRRAQTWIFVSIIAAAYLLAELTLGLLRSRPAVEIFSAAGWATLNAIGSSLIAMGFLPLFEAFTRITTNQTLLELADLNRPLLRRLALEAPGTYAHSISVANLAEAAARAVGANGLLARVGIYYHDVGKMVKPQYYIENQPQGRNPHDKLKPATSASIVRSHVLDGMRLAEEHKLPDSVKAFIAEHHGTQLISFFYDRARELNPDGSVNSAEYQYPGPRPQSKETAIAMLADSVESATRALSDPTPERIRELVRRVVDGKVKSGQLDDTPLTLREINRIEEQLASMLSGMYHQRIDYPPTRPAAEPDVAAAGVERGDGE